jgi:hypothetical protein
LLLTYPSVLLAATASSRYFMPLYPCAAVLAGLLVDQGMLATGRSYLRVAWRRYAWGLAIAMVVGMVAAGANPSIREQPWWLLLAAAVAAIAAMALLIRSTLLSGGRGGVAAIVSLCGCIALSYTGLAMNVQRASWNNARPAILAAKGRLPDPTELVSFGTVDHRFAYLYDGFIPEAAWPIKPEDVPEDVEYFCFNRNPWHRPDRRADGRGRSKWVTLGIMPFEREEVAVVNVERRIKEGPQPEVVIGRIVGRKDSRLAKE